MRIHPLLRWMALFFLFAFGVFAVGTQGVLVQKMAWIRAPFAPFLWVASAAGSEVIRVTSTVQEIGTLVAENTHLREENARLRSENIRLQALRAENTQLRTLLKFKELHPHFIYRPAFIIGRGSNNVDAILTIDAGSRTGIKPGMAVVDGSGLVGQIIEVSADASLVLPVTSPGSAIPARILGPDSQATGVVQEEVGNGVVLKYVQATAPLRIGDEVVTSGMGGTFPTDLPIGTITAIQQSQVDVFQQALLHLNATVQADSSVLVITNFLPLQLPTNPP